MIDDTTDRPYAKEHHQPRQPAEEILFVVLTIERVSNRPSTIDHHGERTRSSSQTCLD
jgi:hypothetical protein